MDLSYPLFFRKYPHQPELAVISRLAKDIMERTNCKVCNAEIQSTTADVTGGYCMPCAKRDIPCFEEAIDSRKISKPVLFSEWLKAGFFFLLISPVLLIGGFLFKLFVVIGVAAICRYFFGFDWGQACVAGVFTFLGLQLLGLLVDIPPVRR